MILATEDLLPKKPPVLMAAATARQPTPRYVRLAIVNDDLRVVGHDLVRIGPGLAASIRRMVEGGAL